MAVKIGPVIGIDGESDFRNSIKNMIQQGKTLSAEMDKVKQSFKNADDKQTAYAKVAEKLSEQIENQQKIVDKFREAVEKSTEETGETSDQTLKWKEQLAKAETELEKLKGTEIEAGDATDDMGENVEDVGENMDKAKEKTSTFADVLKANLTSQAIIDGIKAIADVVKQVADAVQEAITGTVQWADDLATLATTSGISTDQLQKMEYMSNLIDVDVSTVTGSMTKLTKSMSSAASGSGTAAEKFQALGVSVTDANGNLRDNEEVFYEVIDALGAIENPTERDAAAMEIFGKSAQELNPMIEAGADRMRELGEEAEATGYVLSEDAVGNLTDVSDAFDRLEKAGDSAKRNAVAAMAPAILEMTNLAVPAMQTFAQNVSAMFSGDMSVGDFTTYLMEQVNGAVEWISANLPTIMAMGTEIIVAILNGLAEGDIAGQAMTIISTLQSSIADNLPQIMEAGVSLILSLVEGIVEPGNLSNLIQSGLKLIMSLTQGLIRAIPQIIGAIPQIIGSLIQAILQNLPLIIQSGLELMVALTVGLIEAIPQIVESIPQIAQSIIQAFKNVDWVSIGTNIMNGIKNGLTSMVQSVIKSAKEIGEKILSGVKGVLGIHSPSRVFREEVGKMIPAGLTAGIDRAMPAAISDMESQMDNLVIGASASLNGINAVSPVGNSVSNNYGGFVINVNAAEGQSANDIAEAVMYRIQNAVNRREAVFA